MTDMAVRRGLHRGVRALRDGRIERVQETGDSSTTENIIDGTSREGRDARLPRDAAECSDVNGPDIL